MTDTVCSFLLRTHSQASVTFLPILQEPCTFDLLVYTDKSASVPQTWENSDPKFISDSTEVCVVLLAYLLTCVCVCVCCVIFDLCPCLCRFVIFDINCRMLIFVCVKINGNFLGLLKLLFFTYDVADVVQQVRLRSFTTKVHKVDTMVAYKSVDDDDV